MSQREAPRGLTEPIREAGKGAICLLFAVGGITGFEIEPTELQEETA